ncbi:uncharacterized protein LOC132564460 [Ylistrum balloti]|uniref:uncharacterized protein LOC132564460 n=1 Tax=Ylistrum balloti TaxID=509963 RepID=UPI002905DCA0|nr:uncharacterized protein LOC132564460 [Ylistrum balloti]
MANMTTVPIVDITGYGLDVVNEDKVDTETVRYMADDICRAMRDIGFCYIKNHGIPQSKIDQMNTVAMEFFDKPVEYKNAYQRRHITGIHGWAPRDMETLNPDRPSDFKEAFNFTPMDADGRFPDVQDFEVTMTDFLLICHKMTLRILDLMSIGLHLEDRQFLRKCHKAIGQKNSTTTLRVNFYPALPSDEDMKPNQVRCGEHSDYGSLTLLFQDDVGGLEVRNVEGEYIPAPPIPGTVLINLGDMMQRWTADELLATKHRVLIPDDEMTRRKSRQSIAFFAVPDNDVMIECLDKSDKYEPISSLQFIQERIAPTY